jgi:hypothetical protein
VSGRRWRAVSALIVMWLLDFFAVLRGHMHIFPFHSPRRIPKAPAAPGGDRSLIAIMREGNLNSRTTPQGSPPDAVRFTYP